ncbi:MAG: hypothetical protein M1608_11825 [Candidatus Omnitrophica bacterium]|nr:hypothetical protein [Candidatus Omnitrophota bacterium]
MSENPLRELAALGQSIWLDYIRRGLITSGELKGLIEEDGLPAIRRLISEGKFLRWEMATATTGALLGINAFDQPNVQESKGNTNRLLRMAREAGGIPELEPVLEEGPLRYYGEEWANTIAGACSRFLARARPRDYVALQAYLPETPTTDRVLQRVRLRLRDQLHLATTVGYGPRFLHSTGQYHKGGPNTGLFIQLTAGHREKVPIPGARYDFGVFQEAQAQGDLEALRKHGRRVIRIHLTQISKGLPAFDSMVRTVLEAQAIPREK